MFAICIEASHQRGLGHLLRMMTFASFLTRQAESFIFILENEPVAIQIFDRNHFPYAIVDKQPAWEHEIIDRYKITHWINDRLSTTATHVTAVKDRKIPIITFDDEGLGATGADLNVFALAPKHKQVTIQGKRKLFGIEYLILNNEIAKYRKPRTAGAKLLVTLGGSDTYGVTLVVAEMLVQMKRSATIIVGPAFAHHQALEHFANDPLFIIKKDVPSLIKEFSDYDLAITGGGITPFEANASGLPCLNIANESWEIDNAKILDELGTSCFVGHRDNFSLQCLNQPMDIASMSALGMKHIGIDACSKIYEVIQNS